MNSIWIINPNFFGIGTRDYYYCIVLNILITLHSLFIVFQLIKYITTITTEKKKESTLPDSDADSDLLEFNRPAVLHIHCSASLSRTKAASIADSLLGRCALFESNASSRADAVYYNYFGDFYVIYTDDKTSYAGPSEVFVDKELDDELQALNENDLSEFTHTDVLHTFEDNDEIFEYLQYVVGKTDRSALEKVYREELGGEPDTLRTMELLEQLSNNDLLNISPDLTFGKWVKVTLSDNCGGFGLVQYNGFPSIQRARTFIGLEQAPEYQLNKMVKNLQTNQYDDYYPGTPKNKLPVNTDKVIYVETETD